MKFEFQGSRFEVKGSRFEVERLRVSECGSYEPGSRLGPGGGCGTGAGAAAHRGLEPVEEPAVGHAGFERAGFVHSKLRRHVCISGMFNAGVRT